MLNGLLANTTPKPEVVELPSKGRGVVTGDQAACIRSVYKTHAIYPRALKKQHEDEYACNGEGCYIVEAQTPKGWICFDATRRFNSWGCLLNHSCTTNCKVFKPCGKWRLGILTIREVGEREELTYDYGCWPMWNRLALQKTTESGK